MQINLQQVVPLGRNGKYGRVTVEAEKFSDLVHNHIYAYGLRQILNDAMADKTDENGETLPAAEIVAKAQKRLDTLYSGELRTRSVEAEPADPVEAEAFRIAWSKVTAQIKATPEYAESKGEKDRVLHTVNLRAERAGKPTRDKTQVCEDVLGAFPDIRKAAERIVRERAKTPEIEI